jgi:hypothetical protein
MSKCKLLLALLFAVNAFAADTGATKFKTDILDFGRPSAANKTMKFRIGTAADQPGFRYNNSSSKMEYSDDGSAYNEFNQAVSVYQSLTNVGFKTSVSSNALTITLTQSDGASVCSTGSAACKIPIRSSTVTTGGYNVRSVTASLTLVIPSGTALGAGSAPPDRYFYVYGIDNAGTVELAVSMTQFNTTGDYISGGAFNVSTTSISGGNDETVMYSTTGRSSVGFRLIGRFLANEATPGTWASNATGLELAPFNQRTEVVSNSTFPLRIAGFRVQSNGTVTELTGMDTINGNCSTSGTGSATYTCTFVSGIWRNGPICAQAGWGGLTNSLQVTTLSTSQLIYTTLVSGSVNQEQIDWICTGAR